MAIVNLCTGTDAAAAPLESLIIGKLGAVVYGYTLEYFIKVCAVCPLDTVEEILKDLPDTASNFEYNDYISSPTRKNASEFITRAIEESPELINQRKKYVEYIAQRPRVEKRGSHGLFTDDNVPINLSKVSETVANHEGIVWTDIIPLKREDAERLI